MKEYHHRAHEATKEVGRAKAMQPPVRLHVIRSHARPREEEIGWKLRQDGAPGSKALVEPREVSETCMYRPRQAG